MLSSNGSNDGDSEASAGDDNKDSSEKQQQQQRHSADSFGRNIDSQKRKMYRKKSRKKSEASSLEGGGCQQGEEEDSSEGEAKNKVEGRKKKKKKDANAIRRATASEGASSTSPHRRRHRRLQEEEKEEEVTKARRDVEKEEEEEDIFLDVTKGERRRRRRVEVNQARRMEGIDLSPGRSRAEASKGRGRNGGGLHRRSNDADIDLMGIERNVASATIAQGADPVEALLETESMQAKKRKAMEKGMSEAEANEKLKNDVKHAVDKVVAISAKGAYESGAAAIKERREQLEAELGKLGLKAKSRTDLEELLLVEDEAKKRERIKKQQQMRNKRDKSKKIRKKKADSTSLLELPALKENNKRAPRKKVVGSSRHNPQSPSPSSRSQSLPPGEDKRRLMKEENKGLPPLHSTSRQKSRSLSPLKKKKTEGGEEEAIEEKHERGRKGNRMGLGYNHDEERKADVARERIKEVEEDEMMIVNRGNRLDEGTDDEREEKKPFRRKDSKSRIGTPMTIPIVFFNIKLLLLLLFWQFSRRRKT